MAREINRDVFELIVTINGSDISGESIKALKNQGATIFRINGAFSDIESVRTNADKIRLELGTAAKILIDLPGYKVRFLNLTQDMAFKQGVPFFVDKALLNYPEALEVLDAHSSLRINDGKNCLEIVRIDPDGFLCAADSSGTIKPGKGLHLRNVSFRPSRVSISDRDRDLIQLAKEMRIEFVGLSFVYDADDILYVKKLLEGSGTQILPKIESKESIQNLDGILDSATAFILDRGDLAGEIGIENIWHVQKYVIKKCKISNRKIFIATQVLSSMINNPLPTIAEIDDLFSLFDQGVDGIQLSEETSVGAFPKDAASAVMQVKQNHYDKHLTGRDPGAVLWLLGPTSAGKTTVGRELTRIINENGGKGIHLDGDEIRNMFPGDHGFSENARLAVIENLVFLANKLAGSGLTVVVSALTAHARAREYVREHIEQLHLVFIDCPMETCIERDHKGLYKKAINGEIDTLIGINTPYRSPDHYEFRVDTEQLPPETAAWRILVHFFDAIMWGKTCNGQPWKC